ncbi:acylneuraminate cytidylyltransferase [Bacteroidia bacterium]|nr:acylneuraminate cytidylyltransferase [Bacteroidia bacterium]GHV03982.1 acylneuraminate cytidylyltransferase [Bacteroidia bacterium]
MTKKLHWLLILGSLLFAVPVFAQQQGNTPPQPPKDWASFFRYEKLNELVTTPPKAVFLGNSITDMWYWADTTFFKSNNYLGRGISSQTTAEMLVRFRADVINLKPKAVVILAGTNDIAQNIGYISQENIFGNIVSMAELAHLHGILPILCSILPVYDYKWRPGLEPAGKIIQINGWMKEYAEKNGFVYVDYHSALKDERDGLPDKYSPDGVHVNKEGYNIMQSIVKAAIDKAVK